MLVANPGTLEPHRLVIIVLILGLVPFGPDCSFLVNPQRWVSQNQPRSPLTLVTSLPSQLPLLALFCIAAAQLSLHEALLAPRKFPFFKEKHRKNWKTPNSCPTCSRLLRRKGLFCSSFLWKPPAFLAGRGGRRPR